MFEEDKEQIELMDSSRQTLEKLRENRTFKQRDPLVEHKENWSKFDKGKDFYEEYDKQSFENKFNVDMLFYEQLLEKLNEDANEDVEKLCSSLYKTVNKIYEFINIRPAMYGGLDETVLEDSLEDKYRKVSKIIYEYLDHNFYKLDPDKRADLYQDKSKDVAKKLISEGNEVNESISYATKVVVMEGLIRKVAFPFSVMSRVNYLLEDEDYGAVFDQQELHNLVEQFYTSSRNLAKVVAACV